MINPWISVIVTAFFSFLSAIAVAIAGAALKFVISSNKEITRIQGKVDILYSFWEREVQAAIDEVHKPHEESKELDSLLDELKILMTKFSYQNLEDDKLIRLIQLLEIVKHDVNITSGERQAAARILNYVEMRHKMMQLGL